VGRPSISSDEIEDRAPEEAFVLVSEASDGTELEPLKVDPEAEGPTGTLGSADEGDPVRVEAAIGAETLLVWPLPVSGIATVTELGLWSETGSPENWICGRSVAMGGGLNLAVAGDIRTKNVIVSL
jgi:hypothetical protein